MAAPFGTSTLRMSIGVGLGALCALTAAGGLLAQTIGAALPAFAGGLASMDFGSAVAILAGCAGWFALQSGRRAVCALGYLLLALMAAITCVGLARHALHLHLGLEALTASDVAARPGAGASVMSDAVAASLALAWLAIALTRSRSDWAQDLRQCVRLSALAIQLFVLALYAYDPGLGGAIRGLETGGAATAVALSLLLIAIGFDRAAASLRWQLATIGALVVAPLLALTVHFASIERDNALMTARERLAVVARLGAERQDAIVAQTRQMLMLLARSDRLRTSDETCNSDLPNYARLYPWVTSLYLIDRDGVVRCSDRADVVGIDLADRSYVQSAFETGQFTVSGFLHSRVSNQPRIVLALPAFGGPGPERLIAATVDVEGLAGPLDGLSDGGETLTLVDSEGLVIARRPRDASRAGANLADATFVTQALANTGVPFVAAELDGRQFVFQSRRVIDGRATLIVGAPRREIVRPVDTRLHNQLLLIASILAGSFALGLLASEALVLRPIRRLIAYAGRLEAGDLLARPDVRASGEIAALGRALVVSASAIEDRERRLAETEALFRGLFDHSPDAKCVIRVEPGGVLRVETWNSAAEAATGLPAREVLGRTPLDVFPGSRGETIERDLRRTLALGRVQTLEREPKINGFATVFEMVQVPLHGPDGAIERIFLSARDISERKRVERLKNEFVSTVSHELRTPLTSIAGSLGLLSGGAAGALSERARHLITIAHSNSLRLVRLINDILDIEKIEAGRMAFELTSVAVGSLVRQAMADIRSYADQYGVDLELDLPEDDGALKVYGDHDRLTQVITNLLSNAIKFSPPGERVTTTIAVDGETVVILVKDRGSGIPESFRDRLFTKFAQADGSDSRRKGGTGLGLAIVREIVERHAGAVAFRTELGKGTEFEVRLPRYHPLSRESAPAVAAPTVRPRILVCEDDALMGAILAEQLRDADFEPLTVGTVRGAMQAVEREELAAVLVDLNLPDGDGLTLIRDIRATAKGATTPIVVVSARATAGRADERSAGLDVADWIEKPVDTSRLAGLLRRRIMETAQRPRILHVEDDADICKVVSAAVAPFAETVCAASVADARRALMRDVFSLAIIDIALEDGSGLDLLNSMTASESPRVPVIIFSAQDAEKSVAARSEAVFTKSRTSLAALAEAARRSLEARQTLVDLGRARPGERARASHL